VRKVPLVQFGLQAMALGQQRIVFWGQVLHQFVKAFPKRDAGHARAGQYLLLNEVVKVCGDLQLMDGGASCHSGLSKNQVKKDTGYHR
jgi:hypothetical protein